MCSSPWAFSTVSNPRLSAKTAFVTHTLLFSLVGVSGISPALKKLLWAPYSEPKLAVLLSHTPGGARELSVTPTRPSAFPHRASRPAPGWIFYPGTAAEISDLQTQTRECSLPEPGSQPLGTRPFSLSPERGGSFRHPAQGAGQPQSASLARNVPVVAQMFQSSGLCSPGTDGRHGVQRDGSSRGIGGVFWLGWS